MGGIALKFTDNVHAGFHAAVQRVQELLGDLKPFFLDCIKTGILRAEVALLVHPLAHITPQIFDGVQSGLFAGHGRTSTFIALSNFVVTNG